MGASGWSYFVPYQEDVAEALKMLQEHIFVEERYTANWWYDSIPNTCWDDMWRVMSKLHQSWIEIAGIDRSWEGFAQAVLEELARVLEEKQIAIVLPKPPQTIEDLLQQTDADGTHSILDIAGIAEQPAFRMATPLSREEHLALLGTEKPTRARVEAALVQQREQRKPWEKGLEDIRGGWQAIYFIVYKDDTPDELCFCGLSGD